MSATSTSVDLFIGDVITFHRVGVYSSDDIRYTLVMLFHTLVYIGYYTHWYTLVMLLHSTELGCAAQMIYIVA